MSEGYFGRNAIDYRERCRQLEEVIGVDSGPVGDLRRAMPELTPQRAVILSMLLKREFIRRSGIYAVLWAGLPDCDVPPPDIADNTIDKQIGNLRRLLEPLGVMISTARGNGWFLSKADRARIRALVEAAPAADLEECARLTDQRAKRIALMDGS